MVKMESWVPLLKMLLNSTCPEADASLWLQQSFNPPSSSISTTSFISLLTKEVEIDLIDASSPSSNRRKGVMWIRTLPDAVQARVLSFLLYDYRRFCRRDLSMLAEKILSEGKELDFWVKRAAQQLFDVLSESKFELGSCLNLDSPGEKLEDEFGSLPVWLRDAAGENDSVLPWLPMSPNEIVSRMQFSSCGENDDMLVETEEDKVENVDEIMEEAGVGLDGDDYSVDPGVEKMATCLKTSILNFESTARTIELAREIQQLSRKGNSLALLQMIEPWKADDETASVFISHLVDGEEDELGWPSHVICSVALPKLISLEVPASRVLMTAIVEYCMVRQKAAEYSLLFPLILKVGGINNPICDVITRIVKECLHPGHASALFQRLLNEQNGAPKLICLPCHQSLIGNELVWTESLFVLMQNILNLNIHLTQDSVDHLVLRACKSTETFSKSLKFCNFLLCFVNKCAPLLKSHKLALIDAVGQTSTLVTKSILSKLSSL